MNTTHMQIAAQFTAAILQGMREQANPTSLTHWYNTQQGFNCESNFYKWTAKVGTITALLFQKVMDENRGMTYIGEPLYEVGERLGQWLCKPETTSDQQIQMKLAELMWDFFKDATDTKWHEGIRRELSLQTGGHYAN